MVKLFVEFFCLIQPFFVTVLGSIFAGLVIAQGLDQPTTPTPEATTEDASGRLLTLPNVEKCANRKSFLS